MAPPRQRTAAIVDDSRSEASSGTREFKTSAPKSRKTNTAVKDKASVTSAPVATGQPIEEQPRVRNSEKKNLKEGKRREKFSESGKPTTSEAKEQSMPQTDLANISPHHLTGPLVRPPPRYPPRLPPRPQTSHPLRLLNRLLPPPPLPWCRPTLPNSPRCSPRPVRALVHPRAQRHYYTRCREILLATPHRRSRPREQGSVCASGPQTLQQRRPV